MEYIVFRRHLIRNNLRAVLLFYDFILIFPYIHPRFRSTFLYLKIVLRFLLIVFFKLHLNTFLKTKHIDGHFNVLSKRTRRYKKSTEVMLKDIDGNLKILKLYPNKEIEETEIKFLVTYSDRNSPLKIPKFESLKPQEVMLEFIPAPNLLSEIRAGKTKKDELLSLYKMVSNGIDQLYSNETASGCLIHGDLNPSNIMLENGTIHIIDFSDAHVYDKNFDKFNFLKELLYFYYGRDRYDIVGKFFSEQEIEKYRAHCEMLRKEKFYE